MNTARFSVRAATGYDSGHLAPHDRGMLGAFDTLSEARTVRDAYIAKHAGVNSPAAFAYADIIDRDDEHAVIGLGFYGNGQRITSVRLAIALAATDDVLFRGSRGQCEAFRA